MAIPAECIHWAKFENNIVEKGTNWTENGAVTYEPVTHNNGARLDANTELMTIADFIDGLDANVGCIEFQAKMLFASTDGTHRNVFEIGTWASLVGKIGLFSYFDRDQDDILFYIRSNAAGKTAVKTNDIAWSINDLIHIAYVWDKDAGLEGGKRAAIYWNGVDQSSIWGGSNLDWTPGMVLEDPLPVVLGKKSWGASNIIFDNVKIWNYAKTDFTDRNDEGWPEGGGRLIGSKMIAPLIDGNLMIN